MGRITLRRKNTQPTLAHVAAEAGVSISAVSRILCRKKIDCFNPGTVKRVIAAAEKLRYRPNRLVRGIQTGQTGLIGVVMPAYDEFYGMVMAGIHDALVEKDYLPVVLWSSSDGVGRSGRTELEQIHALVDLRVEGIILKPVYDAASDEYLHEIIDRKIPLVVVDRALPRANASFVGSDDEAAMVATLDYLKSLGHRRIVYFGPDTPVSTGVHRLHSFRAYFERERDLQATEFLTPGWKPSLQQALACLRASPEVTAVVAVHDGFARVILEAAAELGRNVPGDLSVAGHGNLPFARYITPRLTTIDQHPIDIGMTAARTLLSRIENPVQAFCKTLIPPQLLVRDSTAPAARVVASGSRFGGAPSEALERIAVPEHGLAEG